LKYLEELTLLYTSELKDISAIAHAPNLRKLKVHVQPSEDIIQVLFTLPKLEHLDICDVPKDLQPQLKELPHIKSLKVNHTSISLKKRKSKAS